MTESVDKRELIICRLVDLATGLGIFKEVYRNKDELADAVKPALVVLDGGEAPNDTSTGQMDRQRRPANVALQMAMTPDILFAVAATDPKVLGRNMGDARRQLIKAIMADQTLLDLVGTNGMVRYDGCETMLGTGNKVQGLMQLKFTFLYFLEFAKL